MMVENEICEHRTYFLDENSHRVRATKRSDGGWWIEVRDCHGHRCENFDGKHAAKIARVLLYVAKELNAELGNEQATNEALAADRALGVPVEE